MPRQSTRTRTQTVFYQPANRVPRRGEAELAQIRMNQQRRRDDERYFGENRDNEPVDLPRLLEKIRQQNISPWVSFFRISNKFLTNHFRKLLAQNFDNDFP